MDVVLFALLLIVFIVLIAVVFNVRNSIMERFDRLEREIAKLRELPAPPIKDQPHPEASPAQAPPQPTAQPPEERTARPIQQQPEQHPDFERMPDPGFFERHPDLEKFIGENLVSKIGIAVLVLAIAFFVKYAIDNNWIGPAGRVGVGIVCGGILLGIAHWLRKQYQAFSSVLVGGGLAVLYCTIALAFHQYQLLGQTTAFIVMLVITAFSVLLSLLYDRQELAIIALVGGFITPFLVSNGRGDYAILFTYLLILNTGLLVMAYHKAWRLLNILAFGFTALLYASWLVTLPYDASNATYRGGWIFGTIFYFLFFVINIAYTIRSRKQFIASDFIILLANTCLYFAAGLYLLEQLGLDRYKGMFSAAMGIFNLAATWLLFRKRSVDKNILYLLVGITLSFVSLTAPLQLHGHYITLFWATEAVLLYWLFLRSQIRLMRLSSVIIWIAMLLSLVTDWMDLYFGHVWFPILFNKGFLTGVYAALCSAALFFLRKESRWAKASMIAAVIILYLAGALELNFQIGHRLYYIENLVEPYLTTYTWFYFLLFARFCELPRLTPFRLMSTGLLVAGALLYLVSLPATFNLQATMLQKSQYLNYFFVHWIGAALVVLILYQLFANELSGRIKIKPAIFTWLISIITVILLSAEGQLLVNMIWYSKANDLEDLSRIFNKTGLPILWGLCSFAFMWLGMRHKFKPLRIVSLALFSITLVKLFLFDIRNIPVAGKIAAFFCLGVLLLVVSFMYQRLKKIFIIIWLSLTGLRTAAQGVFTYQAILDSVDTDGFYQIALRPDLVSKCSRPDMGDLRILGPDDRFVSYALKDSQEARVPGGDMIIPDIQMAQKDSSNKHSYISITYPGNYTVDWIGFGIRSPVFFKRDLQILAEGINPGEWIAIAGADLDPAHKLFRIPTVRTRRLLVDISNADNAPLEIREIDCFQTSRYLVAYLRAGRSYRLLTGNAQAATPDYDLKYFTDSLKTTPHTLFIHSLQRIGKQDQPPVQQPLVASAGTKNRSGLLLWCCLLAVLLFLIYFSVKMVKAIGKKDPQ